MKEYIYTTGDFVQGHTAQLVVLIEGSVSEADAEYCKWFGIPIKKGIPKGVGVALTNGNIKDYDKAPRIKVLGPDPKG